MSSSQTTKEQVYYQTIIASQKFSGNVYVELEKATELIEKAIWAIERAEYESTKAYAVLKGISDKSWGYDAESNSAPYHLMEEAKKIRTDIQSFYDRYNTSKLLSDVDDLKCEAEEFEQHTYDVEKAYLNGLENVDTAALGGWPDKKHLLPLIKPKNEPKSDYYEQKLNEIQEYTFDLERGK